MGGFPHVVDGFPHVVDGEDHRHLAEAADDPQAVGARGDHGGDAGVGAAAWRSRWRPGRCWSPGAGRRGRARARPVRGGWPRCGARRALPAGLRAPSRGWATGSSRPCGRCPGCRRRGCAARGRRRRRAGRVRRSSARSPWPVRGRRAGRPVRRRRVRAAGATGGRRSPGWFRWGRGCADTGSRRSLTTAPTAEKQRSIVPPSSFPLPLEFLPKFSGRDGATPGTRAAGSGSRRRS